MNNSRIRAAKYGVPSLLKKEEWLSILEQSQGICFYCKGNVGIDFLGMDHVIPMSKGGSNTIDNIVPACEGCNKSKGNREQPKPLHKRQKLKIRPVKCFFCGISPVIHHIQSRMVNRRMPEYLYVCEQCWEEYIKLGTDSQNAFRLNHPPENSGAIRRRP